MKPKSEWNTWVGALVGAVPPVMGYTAATQGNGLFDIEAALVGGILFLWQFPHFFALSWMHRLDYARGGFQMVSRNDMPEGNKTARLITRYTYFMATMPFLSTLADVTNSMFAIEGIALNGYAIYVAKKFEKERSNANARKVFLTSLWYLPCWMTLYILHSRKWKEGVEKEDDTTITRLKKHVEDLRARGKELCLHEILILGGRDERAMQEQKEEHEKCPVFASSKKE
jgi:protoheme IX farnesyltransferase